MTGKVVSELTKACGRNAVQTGVGNIYLTIGKENVCRWRSFWGILIGLVGVGADVSGEIQHLNLAEVVIVMETADEHLPSSLHPRCTSALTLGCLLYFLFAATAGVASWLNDSESVCRRREVLCAVSTLESSGF